MSQDRCDVNPLWNPQIRGDRVVPPEAAPWRDRANVRPGMAALGGTLVTTFRSEGWRWGGRWPRRKDYQHFSPVNR